MIAWFDRVERTEAWERRVAFEQGAPSTPNDVGYVQHLVFDGLVRLENQW